MRIREGCILTATNSNDERVKSLIGCKGALHVVNGEPLRFVVGSNENARSFTTAHDKAPRRDWREHFRLNRYRDRIHIRVPLILQIRLLFKKSSSRVFC